MSGTDRKARIRQEVWDRLVAAGAARFPFPPHGRIPNFAGAAEAAARLFELPLIARAKRIKVNPDAPQRAVRIEALRRGIRVYVPTPRLRGGFLELDPSRIPRSSQREACSLAGMSRWAQPVELSAFRTPDALVVGSVAVSLAGQRCGKGEGYADLEYGALRELGHPPVPVVTTVHATQIVTGIPGAPTDLPLAWIVTPARTLRVRRPPPAPSGIDWSCVGEAELDAMPLLRELRDRSG
jgi:5-formyltetrahydrofolate cyclo-ligase